jgi:ABC-type glycerol-3-phosphate transport system permease component
MNNFSLLMYISILVYNSLQIIPIYCALVVSLNPAEDFVRTINSNFHEI